MSEQKFNFWVPVEIEKAKDKDGNEIMKVGGIASTAAQDTDGETLLPEGFDLSYFLNKGFLNYNHQAKTDPMAVIGEPTDAKVTPDGLYIEGVLYNDNPIAKSVFEMTRILQKNSGRRKMGFSIEGKALERDSRNPKLIKKAAITGCALTLTPKNPKTFVDILKGDIDDSIELEFEQEDIDTMKVLSAGSVTGIETVNSGELSGTPLKEEKKSKKKEEEEENEEEKTKKLEKSDIYTRILGKYTTINLVDAEKIYNYILKTMENKNQEFNPTSADIDKALATLDKSLEISKGGSDNDEPKDEKADMLKSFLEKKNEFDALKKSLIEKGFSKEEMGEEEEDEDEEKEEKEKAPKEKKEVEKSFETIFNSKMHSTGVILKGIYDSITELKGELEEIKKATEDTLSGVSNVEKSIEDNSDLIKSYEDKFEDLQKSLDAPMAAKSVRSIPRERQFVANQDLEKGQNLEGFKVISLTNKKQIVQLLDDCTFAKGGMDEEFAKSLTSFETSGVISESVLERLKKEQKIVITK